MVITIVERYIHAIVFPVVFPVDLDKKGFNFFVAGSILPDIIKQRSLNFK